MSTHPPSNVIDLTEDSPEAANNNSQPRNRAASERDHHVHLVSARPSLRPLRERIPRRTAIEAEAEGSNTVDIRESSPEVEFVSARPRSVSQSDQSRQNRPAQPGNVPGRPPSFRTRRGNLSDTSQMMGLRLPDNMRTAIAGITGPFRFGGFMARSGQEELVTINDLEVEHFEGIDMGVGMQGFNLDNPSRPVQQPRLPTYEAPPPARSGYTRDLKEEDILVCPNCDDELGVGEEEMKRQVWVIKGCGHVSEYHLMRVSSVLTQAVIQVYCGECARSRPPKTSKKNAASPRFSKSTPFKTCKVDGCQKNITRSNFIQVYL